jgi:MerR family transcriptional regulator, light-induced transcriptional regulator
MAIREVAEQTGLTAGTIRAWESRYGFPAPQRTQSGYRVYSESDVEVLRRVAAMRKDGVSVAAALDRARSHPTAAEIPSFFGVVPHDGRARTLRKSTLISLSRAIEDAAMAISGQPIVLGAFQHEKNYRRVQHRYERLVTIADEAVVFADFTEVVDVQGSPVEVPIAAGAAVGHEWAVVVDSPGFGVCLVAWEPPVRHEPDEDLDRRFEAFWTLDPGAVRRAAVAGAAVARATAPDVADRLDAALADRPLGAEPRVDALEGLTQRMVAYLEAG